jgi:hypothetical protein
VATLNQAELDALQQILDRYPLNKFERDMVEQIIRRHSETEEG